MDINNPSVPFLQVLFLILLTTTIFNSFVNLIFTVSLCWACLLHSPWTRVLDRYYADRAARRGVRAELRRRRELATIRSLVGSFLAESIEQREQERRNKEMREVAIQTLEDANVNVNAAPSALTAVAVPLVESAEEPEAAEGHSEAEEHREAEEHSESEEDSESEEESEVEEHVDVEEGQPEAEQEDISEWLQTVPEHAFATPQPTFHRRRRERSTQPRSAPWADLIPIDEKPLENGFTCIGLTKKGTRCGQWMFSNNARVAADARLRLMRSSDPGDSFELHRLKELADWMLCPRWHRDKIPQGDEKAESWYRAMRPARTALEREMRRRQEDEEGDRNGESLYHSGASSNISAPALSFGQRSNIRDDSPPTPYSNNTSPQLRFQSLDNMRDRSPPTPYSSKESPKVRLRGPDTIYALHILDSQVSSENKPVARNLLPRFQEASRNTAR